MYDNHPYSSPLISASASTMAATVEAAEATAAASALGVRPLGGVGRLTDALSVVVPS